MGKPNKKTEKAKLSKGPREQTVAQNRAASFHYHILEKLEAGLVLHGTEVKALREGKANIRDAFVDFKPSGAYLVNAHIAQYMPGGRDSQTFRTHRIERIDRNSLANLLPRWHCQSRNRSGSGKEGVGSPPGRAHQGSPQGSGTSHVSQPEAINYPCR